MNAAGRRSARLAVTLGLVALLTAAIPGRGALAADPTAPPTKPSCAERYPADGPGGLDLQLGCVAAELVASYTGRGDAAQPAPLSSYLEPLLLVTLAVAGGIVAIVLARRVLGRRLAPVTSDSWWSCTACRSVNPEVATRCYACRASRTEDAEIIRSRVDPPIG